MTKEQLNKVRDEHSRIFRDRRKELGLTQQQVADRAGFTLRTVANIESQNKKFWLGGKQLVMLKNALGLPLI